MIPDIPDKSARSKPDRPYESGRIQPEQPKIQYRLGLGRWSYWIIIDYYF